MSLGVAHQYIFGKRGPRGKTGAAWEFTTFLKERAPLVYVFIVRELRMSSSERDLKLQKIINEWRQDADRTRPNSRELTAYIIERAMTGAWKVWGIKPPYSEGDHDAFFRRYIHGHADAIKVFRSALRQPLPWHRHHVGHQIKWFLGKPGEAARHYKLLKPTQRIPFLQVIREQTPSSLPTADFLFLQSHSPHLSVWYLPIVDNSMQ